MYTESDAEHIYSQAENVSTLDTCYIYCVKWSHKTTGNSRHSHRLSPLMYRTAFGHDTIPQYCSGSRNLVTHPMFMTQ